jgi:hypothetical protein
MKVKSYPTVEKVLAASFYPNLQQILDESDRLSSNDIDTMDGHGLDWGYHIFNESLNPADTEPDMAMRGMGRQINRMGG